MGLFDFIAPQSESQTSKRKPGVFAGLDVGASKIACFIAKTEETLAGIRPRVIGVGQQSSRGIKAGAIIDMDAAADAIRIAVENAERLAGHTISEVSLATSVGSPYSARIAVDMDIAASEVSDRDLRRILSTALREHEAPGRALLHALPLSWRVDGYRGVRDPRGMFGNTLGVDLHVISSAAEPLQNLIACVERCQLSVAEVVVAPYASAMAVLTADEIELGTLMLDMGAQTTSLAILAEGSLQHIDSINLGGAHVTNDIARGLQTSVQAAERIKVLQGSALDSPDDDQQMVEAPPISTSGDQGMNQHPKSLLNAIIRPRLEEIFEILRDRLDAAGVNQASVQCIILTGGASQLPGVSELVSRVFGLQVRTADVLSLTGLGDAVSGPAFSACAGIIQRHVSGPREAISGPPRVLTGAVKHSSFQNGDRGPMAILRWLAESF